MHDIETIRDDPQAFDAALKRRGLKPVANQLLSIDEIRRARIRVSEGFQAERNALSREIGLAKKANEEARVVELTSKANEVKESITNLERENIDSGEQLTKALAELPNLPLAEVPDGADEHGNVQRHVFGKARDYAFTPKPHYDLGEAMGFMDFEAAAKLSGARFVVLKKGLARLERALGQFMLDVHTNEHGYIEVNPPLLVRDDAMFGTAQLPKFAEDQFSAIKVVPQAEIEQRLQSRPGDISTLGDLFYEIGISQPERYWLIPTAEVPLTNLVRESILDEKELPLRMTALTPCFRAEAGAAGRDTRGMIRQHQFSKVELVSITTPETSKDEHERMLSCAEEVLKRLDLHYRVMTLCTGDMGFASQKTYDIEVWMPGQGEGGAYREISSCSVCGDFQARRMKTRYRPRSIAMAGVAKAGAARAGSKVRFVHTLNGSGTAVGRALIAVMENYQQEDGSIAVPSVLQPYMGGLKVIERTG